MNNFKHPQYLTPNGFVRSAKKPKFKSTLSAAKAERRADAGVKNERTAKTLTAKGAVAQNKSGELSAKTGLSVKTTVIKASAPTKLRILAEKRVLAKQKQQRRERGISDKAAKAIAEALTAMLHSK